MAYFDIISIKAVGKIEERMPKPTAAPQTDAPTPHTCKTVNPKAVAIIPIIETTEKNKKQITLL